MSSNDYDVIRHVREWPPEDEVLENGRVVHREPNGKFGPPLPPLVRRTTLCICGHRRGLHRWGDAACPFTWPINPGSGQPHWRENAAFVPKVTP